MLNIIKTLAKLVRLLLVLKTRYKAFDILITFNPWFFKSYLALHKLMPAELTEMVISSLVYTTMPVEQKVSLLMSFQPKDLHSKMAQIEALGLALDYRDLGLVRTVQDYLNQVAKDKNTEISQLASETISQVKNIIDLL